MINLIHDKRTAREVVRISCKNESNLDKNPGKTASFILRSMILEDKEVYLKFISEGKLAKELTYKAQTVLTIMQRMLNESLESICGGYDKVPLKYRGKRLVVLSGLPYRKDTVPSNFELNEDGSYSKVVTENANGDQTKRATVIKLYLAIDE